MKANIYFLINKRYNSIKVSGTKRSATEKFLPFLSKRRRRRRKESPIRKEKKFVEFKRKRMF
jgi:hypothetical protein